MYSCPLVIDVSSTSNRMRHVSMSLAILRSRLPIARTDDDLLSGAGRVERMSEAGATAGGQESVEVNG